MKNTIIFLLLIIVLINTNGCVYTSNVADEKSFYIETLEEIDSINLCLSIGKGKFKRIGNRDRNIYHIYLEKVIGGGSIGISNHQVDGENTERLYFHKCGDNLNNTYLKLSYNQIIKLDSYQLDSLKVFLIGKISKY